MHELRIAMAIIDQVTAVAGQRNIGGISVVGVRVGVHSGVDPDALTFSYRAATSDTNLSGSQLAVEMIPATGRCLNCGCDFAVGEYVYLCPHCHSRNLDITQGCELELAYIEVEDEGEFDGGGRQSVGEPEFSSQGRAR